MNVLQAVGNTSLVRLRHVVPDRGARILAKLEWENPTGNLEDRMANAVIARAEADGRRNPAGSVIEYTGGSAGNAELTLVPSEGGRTTKKLILDDRGCSRVEPRA